MFNELAKAVGEPRACLSRASPIEALHTISGSGLRGRAAAKPGPRRRLPDGDRRSPSLPLFYNAIEPLNLDQHGKMKVRGITSMPEVGQTHAVPLTVDEFTLVQRHYPIVFSVGDTPVPIALMGLNEGVNVFLDEAGRVE